MGSSSSAAALFLLLFVSFSASSADASGLGFEFHHRFSDRVREWAEANAMQGVWWPEKGTVEYYSALSDHDRALRGRSLASANGGSALTFVDGNATYRLSSLGFLHYAIVALGTPNVTFLVALDTGSNLFWVPCNCRQCSSFRNLEFDTYSPGNSTTSQKVFCNDTLCDRHNACTSRTNSCPYQVNYLSENTSSSGVLVEDILYLTTEGPSPRVVKAPIVFGCGDNQTGLFLEGGAPNGLFGLGLGKVSVPSILASRGFTSDSFSMCFGYDEIGRINFGDKGSSDQQETPLVMNRTLPIYMINITGISVGNTSINLGFPAIVDSGTSFTALSDPMYTSIAQSFNAQVKERRLNVSSNLTFEYCYELSPTQTSILLPDINFTTNGGSIFPVHDPIVVLQSKRSLVGYCLAIVKIDQINIFGQNFLTGLQVVFDRERHILGWKNSDCYNADNTSTSPAPAPAPAAVQVPVPAPAHARVQVSAPVPASSPSDFTRQSMNPRQDGSPVPARSPSGASRLKAMSSLCLAILMLSLAFIW
ncbi:aspartyl protease family protein 1-like [Zingiber officinale]|uniref:aspartyl protease family protein 1-like n=1 Tax=Zingiber officinale TaxID=94328 RepID=UPI001C4D6EB8|nr:aspartyl protease family protein 1-like [Zingiber officinale]